MIKKHVWQYLRISFGVLLVAIAFYFFMNNHNLVSGGITGVATVLEKFNIPIQASMVILIGNCFCLLLGFIYLGKQFTMQSLFGSILLPLYIFIFEICKIDPDFLYSNDNGAIGQLGELSIIIISVIAGGILMAVGLGICFRSNATTGGMDIIQKVIAKKMHVPYSHAIYVTDGLVVLAGCVAFGFELGFYSLVLVYIMAQMIDYVSMGGKSRRTAYIISEHSLAIKEEIYRLLERGVTECPVFGGYSHTAYTMLICTLTKTESYMLKDIVLQIDKDAFTFFSQTKEVEGDGF